MSTGENKLTVAAVGGLNFAILRWLAGHAAAASAIVELCGVLFSATSTLAERADAFKGLVDQLVAIAGDFPGFENRLSCTQNDLDELKATYEARGDGHILQGLAEVIGKLMPLIQTILPLLIK